MGGAPWISGSDQHGTRRQVGSGLRDEQCFESVKMLLLFIAERSKFEFTNAVIFQIKIAFILTHTATVGTCQHLPC